MQKDDVKVTNSATHGAIIPVQNDALLLVLGITPHE